MSQFWDTYAPDCGDCRSYERELKAAKKRITELELELNICNHPGKEIRTCEYCGFDYCMTCNAITKAEGNK